MAKCGRRPVLDEMKRREILAILSIGGSRRTAARYVNCSPSTIAATAQRDPTFTEALSRSEQAVEIGYLKNIQEAAKKAQYWRAAAWALERTHPEAYAARSPDAITVKQVGQLLARFAQIIVEEVPTVRYRKRVLKRLDSLTAELRRKEKKVSSE